MGLRSVLREPLLHFAVIGAALFGWYQWGGGESGSGSTRIAITGGHIDHLAASYAKAWRRPPTEVELKGLIDDWVREEIAIREAVAAGLDQGDTIIRRRLRQKFEFLIEDLAQAVPPTDEELSAWLVANSSVFEPGPRVTLRQIYLNSDQRGPSAAADAAALLDRLNSADPDAEIDLLGDPTMLPPAIDRAQARDIDRLFGPGFADQIAGFVPGAWSGPVKSVYGLHLVQVRERIEGALPALAEIRPLVEREFLTERRQQQLDAVYEALLAKYTVVIEPRHGASAASDSPSEEP